MIWKILYLVTLWAIGLCLIWLVVRSNLNEGVRAAIKLFAYLIALPAGWGTFIFLLITLTGSWSESESEVDPWHAMLLPWLLLPVICVFEVRSLFHRTVRLDDLLLPERGESSEKALKIAHLSDLHLTQRPTLGEGHSRTSILDHANRAIRWATESTDLVVLAGDITDRGDRDEWGLYEDIISQLDEPDRNRILVIPGNHDLSLTTSFIGLDGGAADVEHELRCRRFVEHCLAHAPRTWRLSRDPQTPVIEVLEKAAEFRRVYEAHPPKPVIVATGIGASLSFSVPQQLSKKASEIATEGLLWPTSKRYLYRELLTLLYPMVLFENETFVVVGLNSSTPCGTSILSSAFGQLGRKQLREFERLVELSDGKQLIILIHHHVGFTPAIRHRYRQAKPWISAKALQLRDGKRLVRKIKKRGRNVLILHGHKHIAYQASFASGVVLSAPSVAYGDSFSDQNLRGFAYAVSSSGEITLTQRFQL